MLEIEITTVQRGNSLCKSITIQNKGGKYSTAMDFSPSTIKEIRKQIQRKSLGWLNPYIELLGVQVLGKDFLSNLEAVDERWG